MTDPIIRPTRPEDAEDLHELRTQPSVVHGTLQLPTVTLETVRGQAMPLPNLHSFVAEVNRKVVGQITIYGGQGRSRHSADLGISIHEHYQGKGVGRKLMSHILTFADQELMLERIALSVYTDNERAIHLYQSSGFEAEGVARQAVRRDGTYADLLYMGRLRGRALTRASEPPMTEKVQGVGPAAVNLRPLRPEDIPALYRILMQPTVLEGCSLLSSLQEQEFKQQMSGLSRENHIYVAEIGGVVIGYAHLTQYPLRRSHSAQIKTVAVDPKWQGHGIGSALLQALIDLADKWLGVRRLEFHVPIANTAAVALCIKHGFETEVVERAATIQRGQYGDVYLMGRVMDR